MQKDSLNRAAAACDYRTNSGRCIHFDFTKDIYRIQQLIMLRQDLHDKDPKLVGFREFKHGGLKDYTDRHHITQVLMDGDECIGGGRLSFSSLEEKQLLPLEIDLAGPDAPADHPLLLRNLLPDYPLGEYIYAEASRMLVHPDYRNDWGLISQMFVSIYNKSIECGARYLFAMTDPLRCRMYKKINVVNLNLHAVIFKDLKLPDLPDFEGVPMQLMVWDAHRPLAGKSAT